MFVFAILGPNLRPLLEIEIFFVTLTIARTILIFSSTVRQRVLEFKFL